MATDSTTSPEAHSTSDEKFDEQSLSTAQNGQPEDQPEEQPPRDIQGWRWYLTVVSILFSTFLYALDATVVADLQPVIIEEFGEINKLSWLSVAFLLCGTVTTLFWGRIYGQFDAKWLYILHVAVFEIGSALCGAAPSMNVMILGRAITGLGGSGLYVGCMTLIAGTTTMKERPLYVSGTGFTWGLGIVLGPVIGGAFSQSSAGWRWAFYINLLIGAACAPVYLFLLPSKDPQPGASFRTRASNMDYPGTILQAGALTTFFVALNMGGVTYPWDSGRIIALWVVSGVSFIALGFQQVWNIFTTQAQRIIPVQFFRSRMVLILFSATAAGGACSFVPIYMVPVFFQFTRGDGPLDAGVRLLPYIVLMVVTVFVNGALMSKLGYIMPWYLGGGLLVVAGSALMYTVDQQTPTSQVYGFTILLGVGVGMFLQASFSVAQAVVDVENIAPAISFITLAQTVGITMALAIANAILLNDSQAKIQAILPDVPLASIQASILGSRSELVKSLSPELKVRVLDAIVEAIGKTYSLTIAGGGLVALLSLVMPRNRLFGGQTKVAIHAG